MLRERTGANLKIAKDAVENYGQRHGIEWASNWTGVPLWAVALIVVAVVAVVAVVFFFGR